MSPYPNLVTEEKLGYFFTLSPYTPISFRAKQGLLSQRQNLNLKTELSYTKANSEDPPTPKIKSSFLISLEITKRRDRALRGTRKHEEVLPLLLKTG